MSAILFSSAFPILSSVKNHATGQCLAVDRKALQPTKEELVAKMVKDAKKLVKSGKDTAPQSKPEVIAAQAKTTKPLPAGDVEPSKALNSECIAMIDDAVASVAAGKNPGDVMTDLKAKFDAAGVSVSEASWTVIGKEVFDAVAKSFSFTAAASQAGFDEASGAIVIEATTEIVTAMASGAYTADEGVEKLVEIIEAGGRTVSESQREELRSELLSAQAKLQFPDQDQSPAPVATAEPAKRSSGLKPTVERQRHPHVRTQE